MTLREGSIKPGESHQIKYTDPFRKSVLAIKGQTFSLSSLTTPTQLIVTTSLISMSWDWKSLWATHDTYFWLTTSIIGVNVIDTWISIQRHPRQAVYCQYIYHCSCKCQMCCSFLFYFLSLSRNPVYYCILRQLGKHKPFLSITR